MRPLVLTVLVALVGCGGGGSVETESRSDDVQRVAAPQADDSSKQALASAIREGAEKEPTLPVIVGKDVMQKMLKSMLTDSDPHNDQYAAMMLEAGGLSAYLGLDAQKKAALHTKHGVEATVEDDVPAADMESLSGFGSPVTPCIAHLPASFRGRQFSESGVPTIVYTVDGAGRAGSAGAQYTNGFIPGAARDGCSVTVGTWGSPPAGQPLPIDGYQGGHLIAYRLGGTFRRYNLTPQAYQINNSSFKRVEAAIHRCASRVDRMVTYGVVPGYSDLANTDTGSSVTPTTYTVVAEVVRRCVPGAPCSGGAGGAALITIPNWTGFTGQLWIIPGQTPPATITAINTGVDAWVRRIDQYCQ
jgi:hypothetical protein